MTITDGAATRLSQLLTQLTDGVEQLTETAQWRRYLDYQSRFHRYSYANTLLIAAQFPGATQVAGFATWRRLHRRVRRGERAIWILAPIRDRRRSEAAPDDEELHGFRTVAVFDPLSRVFEI